MKCAPLSIINLKTMKWHFARIMLGSLEARGKHLEAEHFRLMINCAEICQTSANFLLSGSTFHHHVCGVCAENYEACAKSCEQVGGMEDCVRACRECAESCRQMAGGEG